MKTILIVGATSAMGRECVRLFAARGDSLLLAARNTEALEALAADAGVRGASAVATLAYDALTTDAEQFVAQCIEAVGGIDQVLICHGSLPDQPACEASVEQTRREFEINGLSVIALLTALANHMQQRGRGTLAVITSVAGDRGRQSNYVYGAAKGMVSVFLAGLRNRLYHHGVSVVDIRPGFVDTPMTTDFDKGALWASPDAVARDIVSAMDRGTPVKYTPFFWRWIMLIIRTIPERLFIRLNL